TPVRIDPDPRRDVYISSAGNDAHLGNTPERAVRTWQRARMLMGDNVRVRLRRGDVFDTPAALRLPVRNMIFTHYGDATLPPPVLRFTGPLQSIPILAPDAKSRDIVIDGIAFDSQYDRDGEKNGMPDAIRAAGELLTIRHCVFRNIGYALNANGRPKGVLVEHCSAPEINSIRSYFAWVQGEDHVYRNNDVANSTREHVLRANGIERLAVIGNRFTNLDRTAQDRSDTAKGTCVIQSGSVAFVRDNVFTAGPVGVGPLADGDGLKAPEARFDVAIFENNRIEGTFIEVNHGASRVVLRNNTIDCPGDAAITVHGYNSQYKRGTDDVRIERNVARNTGTRGRFLRAYGQIGGVRVIGNVYLAPRLQPGSHGTAVIYVEAETLGSFREISNNIWPIGQPTNFAEGGSMYVWPKWSDRRGYLDAAEWNAMEVVRNDRFETLPLDAPIPPGVGASIE
ncbi:MAG TPA: right-handed parallel beta-helix repeat-containing protein, partial [Tepidisphaeraceae bacterium]|nr:right-handed parallel beta-helix repeat-containing protein [Tepidisphaeraceae bacterium]